MILPTQQKKVTIWLCMAFLYNACILNFSYTKLYNIVCKKMTFLWLLHTNHIPKFVFTALYTTFGFFLTNTKHILIALTYTRFILFLDYIDLSLMMWIVILSEKLHIIYSYTIHIPTMWSLCYFCHNVRYYKILIHCSGNMNNI